MKPNVTLQDIADAVGKSKSLVSIALRNNPRVSEKTRRAIRKAAKELGYRQNPLVAAHMYNVRTRRETRYQANIAFIADIPANHPDNYFAQAYLRGAKQRMKEAGYKLEAFYLQEPDCRLESLSKILTNRGIRGIIFANSIKTKHLAHFDLNRFAMAAIGSGIRNLSIHRTAADSFGNLAAVMRRLRKDGFKRIGYVFQSQGQKHRFDEYLMARYLLDTKDQKESQRIPALDVGENFDKKLATWTRRYKPDAIISSSAASVADALKKMPQSLARGVKLYSLTCGYQSISCSGYSPCLEDVAAAAVDLVISQLHHNEYGPPRRAKEIVIEGEWSDEAETASPKESAQRKAHV